MITLTDKEFQLMEIIAHCEMNTSNGATPGKCEEVHTYLWPDERAKSMCISEQAVGGLLSSLQNKGAIGIHAPCRQEPDGNVYFRQAGFDAWLERRQACLAEVSV